jgi:hypothetical protein
MDLPRSSSDIRLATACPVCLGNGGFGSRPFEISLLSRSPRTAA